MKPCSQCKKAPRYVSPISGKVSSYCRDCRKEYKNSWCAANREKVNADVLAWNARNREKVNAGQRERHAANREKMNALERAWKAENPDKVQATRARHRARKHAAFTGCPLADLFVAFIHQHKPVCYWCATPGANTHDHLTPLAKGGKHAIENLQPACKSCNSSKGKKTEAEYIAYLAKVGRVPALDDSGRRLFLQELAAAA